MSFAVKCRTNTKEGQEGCRNTRKLLQEMENGGDRAAERTEEQSHVG